MISFKFQIHIFIILPLLLIISIVPVKSEVDFPEIPKRPTLLELKNTLKDILDREKQNNKKSYDYELEKYVKLNIENKNQE